MDESGGKLDRWGRWRAEAIRDYADLANRAMHRGDRAKSALWGVLESAAEYAPANNRQVATEIALLASPLAIGKAAKAVGGVAGPLFHSIREASRARPIVSTKAAWSAAHYLADVVHHGSSITHAASKLGQTAAEAYLLAKRSLGKGHSTAPKTSLGVLHKSGLVEQPRRHFVLPGVVITASSNSGIHESKAHPHGRGSSTTPKPVVPNSLRHPTIKVQTSHGKGTAPAAVLPASLKHLTIKTLSSTHKAGLSSTPKPVLPTSPRHATVKIKTSGLLHKVHKPVVPTKVAKPVVKTQQKAQSPKSANPRMKLTLPKLGSSMPFKPMQTKLRLR